MKARHCTFLGLGALGLLACLVTIGCEDTAVTAPSGSTIDLTASPATIQIDQVNGQTQGNSTITAQVINEAGIPQRDIPLLFTATGGLLASVQNVCTTGGTCSRSGGSCTDSSQCPEVPPVAIETDDNGIAQDVLTIRDTDPDSVDVIVRATGTEPATISVAKTTNVGLTEPTAVISADPEDRSLTGQEVAFSGNQSILRPDNRPLTCYRWTFRATNLSTNQVSTSSEITPQSSITESFGESFDRNTEQNVAVQLEISDQRLINNVRCTNSLGAGDVLPTFSTLVDNITYTVRCDYQAITLNPGQAQTQSLSANGVDEGGGRVVSFELRATAFDPEDSMLTYEWVCPNATNTPPPGQTATCKYGSVGTNTATVTVTNRCGRIESGQVELRVVE